MVMTRKSPPKRALLGLATSQRLKLVRMIIKEDSSIRKRFAASSQTSHIGNICPRAANFLAAGSRRNPQRENWFGVRGFVTGTR